MGIRKLLKVCTKRHKKYVQKQQKLYAGMFGGSRKKKNKKKQKVEDEEKGKESKKIDVDFSDEALAKQKSELIVSANNNLSLIYIKCKDWSNAIERATNVLNEDGDNLKALMRRGQARLEDGFLDLSKADLKKAQSLDSENSYT